MEGLTLDQEDFRQWLTAKEPDQVVGVATVASDCPAASWIKEALGLAISSVCQMSYSGQRKQSLYRRPMFIYELTPLWLADFITKIDDPPGGCREITAKEALTILDDLEVSP